MVDNNNVTIADNHVMMGNIQRLIPYDDRQ